jgi:DNA processing protein
MHIAKLSYEHSSYPDQLRQISNPPMSLYVLGQLPPMPYVAIVGTRRPTEYGRKVTYQLASELSRAGVAIVSGLAYGLDAVAHQAAVDSGGVAIGVLAAGLDQIYPVYNRSLAIKILKNGGLVSEYPAGITPRKQSFVARNRIISGLCLATIVTEANASSGTLITANFALNQNRLVMAVPGPITSLRSAGPNNLIKSGAIPITDSSDVLTALNLDSLTFTPVKADSREEARLLELLQQGVNTSEELIQHSGFTATQFANIISLMEISGKVRNLGAGQWVSK